MDQVEFSDQILPRHNQSYFLYAVAASILLHAVCSVILLVVPKGGSTKDCTTYLDLTMARLEAPASAAPAKMVAPPQHKIVAPDQPDPEPAAVEPPAADPAPATSEAAATPQKSPASESILSEMGLGLSRGFFRSIADGTSLRADIRPYYMDMLQAINQKWWLDEGIEGKRIAPVPLLVRIVIARNGEIVDEAIMRGSGNGRYDRAVLDAIKKASPLPPLPANYEMDYFEAPIRLVPPLDLMRS